MVSQKTTGGAISLPRPQRLGTAKDAAHGTHWGKCSLQSPDASVEKGRALPAAASGSLACSLHCGTDPPRSALPWLRQLPAN